MSGMSGNDGRSLPRPGIGPGVPPGPGELPAGEQRGDPGSGLTQAFSEWLGRLGMTYDSVVHCCSYRLPDRAGAQEVGTAVIAGLLARPKIFQYFGLPYSGRIAHLAEDKIREIRNTPPPGQKPPGPMPASQRGWPEIQARLRRLSPAQQEVFVLSCVAGLTIRELAERLCCDEATAGQLEQAAVAQVRAASRAG